MATYSSVTCYEEHATVSEGASRDGLTASVTLRCPWGSRWSLVNDIISNQRTWPHGGFATAPVASNASIVPDETKYTVTGQSINYIDALVTVTYDNDEPEDLVAESLEPTAEFLTLDYKRFRWGAANGDPLIEAEAPGKLIKGLNIVRTHYDVTGALPGALLSLVGKCNDSSLSATSLGLSFDTETLLYNPPTLNRKITTDGTEGWNITLKYTYKPDTWNKFWRSENEAYEEIFLVGGGQFKPYEPDDFSSIWTL